MDICTDFDPIMERCCFACFDGEDTVASEEHIISYDEVSFSCSIVVGTFKSSSEVHLLARSCTDDVCSWVFGFVVLSEV